MITLNEATTQAPKVSARFFFEHRLPIFIFARLPHGFPWLGVQHGSDREA